MEKNFLGLTENQEEILILLSEGNEPDIIAKMKGYSLQHVRRMIRISRDTLGANTTIEAVTILVKHLIRETP